MRTLRHVLHCCHQYVFTQATRHSHPACTRTLIKGCILAKRKSMHVTTLLHHACLVLKRCTIDSMTRRRALLSRQKVARIVQTKEGNPAAHVGMSQPALLTFSGSLTLICCGAFGGHLLCKALLLRLRHLLQPLCYNSILVVLQLLNIRHVLPHSLPNFRLAGALPNFKLAGPS